MKALSIAASLALALATIGPAGPAEAGSTVHCGDQITRSVSLTADLGTMASPCSDQEYALLVDHGVDVTIDLKGRTIYAGGNGIYITDSSRVTLKNGRIVFGSTQTGTSGVQVRQSPTVTITGITIEGNVWDVTEADRGIFCSSSTGLTVSKSRVSGSWMGIATSVCSLKAVSVDVSANKRFGIYSSYATSFDLNGVTANDGFYGIYVDFASRTTINNSTASRNIADGIMLYVDDSGPVSLAGNVAADNGRHGINGYLTRGISGTSYLSNNIASGNGDHGINLYGPGPMYADGNTVDSNGGDGFHVDGNVGSRWLSASRNSARGNQGYGFWGGGSVLGSGNKASSNLPMYPGAQQCFQFVCTITKK